MHTMKTGTRALSNAEGFPFFLWFYYRLLYICHHRHLLLPGLRSADWTDRKRRIKPI